MLKTEESRPLASFVEQAYLDYSLYVILDRALPFVGDGLKPVQRRIIYAMAELGLAAPAKPKKSARTVGDVIGKYHPHGDSACYEAMVHMAQPFSQRYPLIDGQGNWGSSDDPKSFAAMRYTESRLSPYAKALLQDLATAEFRPNFDSSLTEPAFLPARLPNVLLNGATGIAVGMATLILPHNLTEIVAACQALLANPELDDEALHQLVPGPDFPGGGVIVSTPEELASLYRTGRGTVRQRAAYEIDGKRIIITALPYQLAGARLQEQIAKLVQQKKLPLLEEMRDESDHENPVRLVLTAKSSREAPRLLEQLWASTDLEKRFSSQMNVIGLDGRPAVKSLKTLLTEWLSFRRQNLRIRCQQALCQPQHCRHGRRCRQHAQQKAAPACFGRVKFVQAQHGKQQQCVHPRAQCNGQRQPHVLQMPHQQQVEYLCAGKRDDGDFGGRFHVLLCVKARGQNARHNHGGQPDGIGGQCVLRHLRVVRRKFAVHKQRGNQGETQNRQPRRRGNNQYQTEAQPPV